MAKIATTATTIINSTSVKPLDFVLDMITPAPSLRLPNSSVLQELKVYKLQSRHDASASRSSRAIDISY